MDIGSIGYYKEIIKEAIMINYSRSKTISLASIHENIELEISQSTSLQPREKEECLQKLKDAYEQIRSEIFGVANISQL